MAESAVAIPTFGNGRSLLATDETDGVHVLAVTTEAPDSAIAIWGFGATKYILGTVESDGIHTLCVSTEAADSGIAIWGWNAEKYVLGTVESDGVHVLCVSTDEPDSSIALPGFESSVIILATVESDGVHVPVVTDAESGDAPKALWTWGNQKTVMAFDTSGDGPAVVPLVLGLGPSYDPDAAAYIDSTGELFPADLNTLVLGIKAAGLWDNHIGSIKKRIGLPSGSAGLTASMVDLRNPSFAGTAVNLGDGSPTAGWDFTAASSQYFDSGWQIGATDSKATQDSTHIGWRVKAASAGSPGRTGGAPSAYNGAGFTLLSGGLQRFGTNESEAGIIQSTDANVTGHWVVTRTGASARAAYRNGTSLVTSTTASAGIAGRNQLVGATDKNGTLSAYFTGRISLFHGGAGLDATQAATLTTLFDAYATAAGET